MTGRDGSSSDDLLRKARKELERHDVTDDFDPRRPSSPFTPGDDADDDVVRSVPPPAPRPPASSAVEQGVPPYEPLEAPSPVGDEPPRPSDEGMTRPPDRIDTGAPATPAGRPRITVGVLIAVLGVGAAIFFAALVDDSTAVEKAAPGTCLNDPQGEIVTDIDPVSCDEPHDLELIGAAEIPGDAFPGNEATFDLAIERCVPVFEDYVGIAYEDSIWWLNAFTPTEEGWDGGDRDANCLVFQFDDDRNVLPVTGSARGTGR